MTRQDDLLGYISELEQKADNAPRKSKVNQRWFGRVVVPITKKVNPEAIVAANTNKRYTFEVLSQREGIWAQLFVTYVAKGANAADAEKKVAQMFSVDPEDVRVETVDIVAVTA